MALLIGETCTLMNRRNFLHGAALQGGLFLLAPGARAASPRSYALDQLPDGASPKRVTAQTVAYMGRKALRVELTEAALQGQPGVDFIDAPTFVLIPIDFRNGVIEVDLAGRINGKGPPTARAFIGVAYRVATAGDRFESIYLRPLNGRKTNPPPPRDKRAIQYFAYPDWKFDRLRKDYPDGRYEAGADIAADEWVALRIAIDETKVNVTVNGRNELMLTESKAVPAVGAVGLWVDRGTEGYFSNLRIMSS